MKRSSENQKTDLIVFIFLGIIITLIVGGYTYYRYIIKIAQNEKENELKAIAELKVKQIQSWRNERIHLNLAVPILNDYSAPLAVLLLRTDPDDFLYPFIQSWPIFSKSAETLLFKKNEQEVVFLNRLLYQSDSVLNTRIPLTEINNTAVQWAMGKTGTIRGKDYRGEEVVSYIQSIPDTDWFMEAKINIDEIFSEAQTRGGYILLLFSLFVVMAILLVILLLNRRKSRIYQELYLTEQQLSRSKAIMAASSDALFVVEPTTKRFVEVNDTACDRLGYTREELLDMTVQDINPAFFREEFPQFLQKVHENGNLLIETFYQKKDGTTIPVELNVRSIQVDGNEYLVSTARDITERNRIERELWEATRRLDMILAATQTHIDIIDADYNLIYVDEQWQKIYGDFIDRKCYEYFLGAKEPCDNCIIHDVLQTKRPIVLERVLTKENNRVIEVHTIPIKDISGKWVTAKFNIDITKRKQAEKALQESEERFRHLVQSTDDIIFTLDTQQRHTGVYGQWLNQGKWSQDMFLGKTSIDIFGEEAAEIHVQSNLRALRGEFARYEWSAEFDGKEHFYQTSLSPMKNNEGEVIGIVGIGRDITVIKEMEKAKQESEAQFRRLVENAPEAIYIQTNYQFSYLNPAACKLFGINSPEELLNRSVIDRFHPSMREKIQQRIYQLNVEKKSVPMLEEIYLRVDGSKVPVEVSAVPFFYQGKNGALVFVRDITKRKKAEQERLKLEEQLRNSQKMEAIGSLAGGVAHDFNNLLSVIIGYTDLVLSGDFDRESIRESLIEVKKACDRATALTQQLLAFSRKQIIQPVLVNLNQIVKEMEKMLVRIIGEEIEFIQALSPDLGLTLADPHQIEQVIMNLVVNAREAMPDGGKLIIETSNAEFDDEEAARHMEVIPGHYVMLAVTDTGCGINEEIRQRIFEPFFTTKAGGTGFGLSTVYGIVKQSKGHIWVYSEPGKGTTFKIFFLREKTQDAVPITPESQEISSQTIGTETILVVEDELSVRNLVKKVLTNAGYTVLTASSGSEALQIVNKVKRQIHLILTDIIMPEMSGKTFVENLMKLYPGMKILFMSGYTNNNMNHQGIFSEMNPIISKPFNADKLTRKIREVLDGVHYGGSVKNEETNQKDTDIREPNDYQDILRIRILPEKLIKKIRDSARTARYDDLIDTIEQIESLHSDAAHIIRRLADEYNYDGILRLVNEKSEGEEKQ